MSNYLGRAGAYAMHKKYPAGSQTAGQLAAERANLQRARAARGQMRHTGSTPYHGLRKTTPKSRGTSAAARTFAMRDVAFLKARTLGVRYMRYKKTAPPRPLRITGIPRRFKSRIGPSRYMGRTQWGSSRTHKFKARLFKRSHRFKQTSHWKQRGKKYTPR
jgi:hypothetical protein